MSAISIDRPLLREVEEVPDGVLLREHLDGEDGAFDVLYQRYNDRLVGWFVRRVNDRVLAEDLAQDTMVRVLKYADSFEQDRPMWPWLKTTAYRVMVNHLQSRPEGEESFEDQYQDEGEFDPLLASVEERPALERVLGGLSERHQTALSLRYVRGWAPDDVADFLDMTTNACNQLMYRARNAARREYERVCGEVRAVVWPLLVPIASRWRSISHRIRGSRWSSSTPQLTGILPSIENALQAAIATAVAMFVVAVATGAGQTAVPSGTEIQQFFPSASLDLGEPVGGSTGTAAGRDSGVDRPARNAPAVTTAPGGGTRQILTLSSEETAPDANSGAAFTLTTETERSTDGDKDRATVTSRLGAKVGHEEDEGDVVFLELYCDNGPASQAACNAIDGLP